MKRLLVNVDTGVGGEIRMALLEGTMRLVLPGLDLEHAPVPVAWVDQPTCCAMVEAALARRPVRLVATLEDAWLLSFFLSLH